MPDFNAYSPTLNGTNAIFTSNVSVNNLYVTGTFSATLIEGDITGSGTANTIVKWTAAAGQGNSAVTDTGVLVAVTSGVFQFNNGGIFSNTISGILTWAQQQTFTAPVIAGIILSGVISGSPTWNQTQTFSNIIVSTTESVNNLYVSGTFSASIPASPVSSVFGRTGAVVAVAGDYGLVSTVFSVTQTFTGPVVTGIILTGTISGSPTWNQVQTFTNAILSSPAITGTISGTPTFGQAPNIINGAVLSGAVSGQPTWNQSQSFTSPTITGAVITGTISGSSTFNQAVTFTNGEVINGTTSASGFVFTGAFTNGTGLQRTIGTTIASGATTIVVTLSVAEADTSYTVYALPTYNTSIWTVGKSTSNFTLGFGTATTNSTQTVDTLVIR